MTTTSAEAAAKLLADIETTSLELLTTDEMNTLRSALQMMAARPEERRTGHKALRVKDGQIETFDPNPPADVKTAAVEWERSCQVQPVLPPNAYEGFLAGAAWASSPRSAP